ncbi:3-methyl-2-oxobutanoate hydroxymethyltransferase [Desulfosporosinus sp. BICA1-9]|uniref:3-methyl-2-oxobutanoate hydroxymethyltransferase n=1 Tax=Desulfosporosinus sp. BICA1-9 TaxID=1531958 RepID=UPI00054B8F84|nr:3-methyl-2-oxobutanoate hydroxymethyltransferase [Desulfosporosinus sp. BICA1-9]KJS50762.1 MAG: 3-methyl-2-oxobutanoate hydroxymethyltransferase [Peptococcaceae bacterium BRH_c23]KJS90368.1 MAG: 3-methyl-2-oxobutanoate hydroxymethyltransferase [Desulfosporosinus sp. BICA1-9]HBW38362.1 3-methyl-2-oxobutanoate hydroxymethyltransferase [Desulfosporosinus sp.]
MVKNKITIPDLKGMKASGQKFKMITVYDFPMASMVDRSSAELILVGDSLGMVIQGHDSTVPVNLEDVLYHVKIVRKGAPSTFVVGDMPFLSYQVNRDEAIRNAGTLLKAGADCVKMEGGVKIAETMSAVVDAGIPVMGHIGLTPQTAAMLGGFKVQGKNADSAEKLLQDALAVQEAGAFAMVLECIPTALAQLIDQKLTIPTISVGAGPFTTGFNLNAYDLLGIFDKFVPKFVIQYAQMGNDIVKVFDTWCKDIDEGSYPAPEHGFAMNDEDLKRLY